MLILRVILFLKSGHIGKLQRPASIILSCENLSNNRGILFLNQNNRGMLFLNQNNRGMLVMLCYDVFGKQMCVPACCNAAWILICEI
jgi:hypothetical protein